MSRNNVQKTLQLLLQVGRLLRGIQKLAKNVLDWIILLLEVINFESYFLVIVDVRQKKKKKRQILLQNLHVRYSVLMDRKKHL